MQHGTRLFRNSWKVISLASIAVMFTQHGFTLKQITGRSMQVSHLTLVPSTSLPVLINNVPASLHSILNHAYGKMSYFLIDSLSLPEMI